MSQEEKQRRSEIGKRFYSSLTPEEKAARSFGKVSKAKAAVRLEQRIAIHPILADKMMWRRYNKFVNKLKVKNPEKIFDILTAVCCDVCGCKLTEGRGKYARHVDHDHKTLLLRGALCNGCNIALGHVGDNHVLLERLVEYLRWSGTNPGSIFAPLRD